METTYKYVIQYSDGMFLQKDPFPIRMVCLENATFFDDPWSNFLTRKLLEDKSNKLLKVKVTYEVVDIVPREIC